MTPGIHGYILLALLACSVTYAPGAPCASAACTSRACAPIIPSVSSARMVRSISGEGVCPEILLLQNRLQMFSRLSGRLRGEGGRTSTQGRFTQFLEFLAGTLARFEVLAVKIRDPAHQYFLRRMYVAPCRSRVRPDGLWDGSSHPRPASYRPAILTDCEGSCRSPTRR